MNTQRLLLSVWLVGCCINAARADLSWLEPALERTRSERGSAAQIAVLEAVAADRAALYVEAGGRIDVLFLYKKHPGVTQVEARQSVPVPRIADLPGRLLASGLPPPPSINKLVDRAQIAGRPALRAVVMLDGVLAHASGDYVRALVSDEGFTLLSGPAAGALAKQAGLAAGRIFVTDASGQFKSKLEVSHLHPSALADPARLFAMARAPLAPGPVRSLGFDNKLNKEFCSAGNHLFYREAGSSHAAKSMPFAAEARIIERLKDCRAYAARGQYEKSVTVFNADDIESLKALACLDYAAALSTWHRHPRYYVQER